MISEILAEYDKILCEQGRLGTRKTLTEAKVKWEAGEVTHILTTKLYVKMRKQCISELYMIHVQDAVGLPLTTAFALVLCYCQK